MDVLQLNQLLILYSLLLSKQLVTDSLAHATDTAATNPTCTDVVSAVDTFFGILTTALVLMVHMET